MLICTVENSSLYIFWATRIPLLPVSTDQRKNLSHAEISVRLIAHFYRQNIGVLAREITAATKIWVGFSYRVAECMRRKPTVMWADPLPIDQFVSIESKWLSGSVLIWVSLVSQNKFVGYLTTPLNRPVFQVLNTICGGLQSFDHLSLAAWTAVSKRQKNYIAN